MEPLIEEAIAHEDLQTVKRLLRKGANPDIYVFESPLRTAMRLSSTKPEYLIVVSQMLLTAEGWEVFRFSASDDKGFLRSFFRSAIPRIILSHACESGDQRLVKLILDEQREIGASECNELLCKTLSARSHERVEIVSLLLTKVPTDRSSSYKPAVISAVRLQDWRSAFEISYFLDIPLSFPKDCVQACLESRDFDGVKFLFARTRPPSLVTTHPFLFLISGYWDSVQDCCRVLEIAANIEELVLNLHDSALDDWALKKHHDHSIFELCQLALEYIGMQPHHTADLNVKVSLLFHLNHLLECLSNSFPFPIKSMWIRALRTTFRLYRSMTALLPRARKMFLEKPFSREAVDSVNTLRLSIVKIAETLLRKSFASEPSFLSGLQAIFTRPAVWESCEIINVGYNKSAVYGQWQVTQDDWNAIDVCLSDWPLDSIMGMVLRLYGFRGVTLDPGEQVATQSTYMPLGWQAWAAGARVTQLLREHVIASDQLRAAELCFLSHSDWTGETIIAKTIVEWRAESCKSPSVDNRVELPAEMPAQSVPTALLEEYSWISFE